MPYDILPSLTYFTQYDHYFFKYLSFLILVFSFFGACNRTRFSGEEKRKTEKEMDGITDSTWVWVNSRSWCWTGRHGVLRFMGSQRVGHDWVTELTDWHFSLLNAIMKIMGIPLWLCSIFSFLYSIFIISIDQSLNSLIVSLSAVTLAPSMTWTVE